MCFFPCILNIHTYLFFYVFSTSVTFVSTRTRGGLLFISATSMRKGCPHVFLGAFFKDLFSCFLKSSLFHVFQQEQEVYSHVFQKHSIIEQVPSLELSFCVFQEQLLCCFLGALMCSCVCMHSMCACTHRCLLA